LSSSMPTTTPTFHPSSGVQVFFIAFHAIQVYGPLVNPARPDRARPTRSNPMTTDTVGVNLAQMAELQRTFDAKAAQVEQLVAEVSRLVGSAGAPGAVHWQGRVADQFRQEWDGVYVKNLRQLTQALQQQ